MARVDWHMTVVLVGGRANAADPIVAVGRIDGPPPQAPVDVLVEGPDSSVVVEGAHEIDPVRYGVADGLFGLVLPNIVRAAVAPGTRIRPLTELGHKEVRPGRVFNGREGQRVGLSPDYGGVVYRTAFGMADVDALEHRVSPTLQAAIWAWYEDYANDGDLTEEEFVAEGERIVDELNRLLGDECVFYLDV